MKTLLLAGLTSLAVAAAGLSFAQSTPPAQHSQAQAADGEAADTQQATPADSDINEDFVDSDTSEAQAKEMPADAKADADFADDTSVPPDSGPLSLRDLRRIKPITGDATAAKTLAEGCADCHGSNGVSIIPGAQNLAGLDATYLYQQMMLYHKGYVPDTSMSPLTDELTEQDMRNLAVYYTALPRKGVAPPAPPAQHEDEPVENLPAPTPEMLATGERLYMEGNNAQGVPPCQGCHGSDALGHPLRDRLDRSGNVPYAMYPALRGQDRESLVARLKHYQSGDQHNVTTHHVMAPISEKLDETSIDAISAWLAGLKD